MFILNKFVCSSSGYSREYPLSACLSVNIIPYQHEIKREQSEHLISPDMVTKESNLQSRF